ncbi:DUF3237 family protein, partial [Thermodesulfobacteriota bacterium]
MFSMGNLEFLASFRAKVTKRIEFGKTPIGERRDVYFEGELTGDILSGKMEGIDYMITRTDGTLEVNVRAVITTNDGAYISVRISGYY